ncbi:hypothetical protein [Dactylosporangium sp. CA-139066]|uniref:hypothetical protein n=1 Tax=Dactylosporangium sp. CA-139066 TaxID=3239930 RepID=UPI003D929497
MADFDRVDQQALLPDARAVAATHVPENGLCRGCLDAWSRLAPHPCTHAQWASVVGWLAPVVKQQQQAGGRESDER